MRKFFKDNIWLFAIVAAILVIQGILGYYRKNQVAAEKIAATTGGMSLSFPKLILFPNDTVTNIASKE